MRKYLFAKIGINREGIKFDTGIWRLEAGLWLCHPKL